MNNSTGEFTFPHTGLYNINMTAQMSDSNNDPRTYVYWQMNKTKGTYEGSSDPNVLLCELPGYRERSTSSKIIHFQAGESFIIHSGTATQPADIYLSITALQDRVPQAISARPGMTLETLVGICDGRSVTVSSGTYTMPNVSAKQDLTTTFTDLTGSNISYKPPPGTQQVIYKWRYQNNSTDGSWVHLGYQLYLDDVSFGPIRFRGNNQYAEEYDTIEIVFYITGTDDYANQSLASWDSIKTIKLKGRERNSSDRQAEIHVSGPYIAQVGGDSSGTVKKPSIEIQAIGDGPGIVPSTGMNIVHASDTVYKNPTISGNSKLDYEFSEMKLIIKPTATDSVIELKYNIFGDIGENICFRVTRNISGTDVLVVPASNHYEGALAVPTYDNEVISTPQVINFNWYDEPNTTSTVTYKLWIGASHNTGNGIKCHLNRAGSTPGNFLEAGVSTAAAIEYPKTARPLDTENALTIPPFVGATNKEKLYNQSGDLYFNGKQLSNEWYKNGGDLYRLGANVGIGKSSPAYKLDVLGDINFSGSIRQNGVGFQVGGLWSGSTDIYRSSGNVGIGTTSPDYKLHVNAGTSGSNTVAYNGIGLVLAGSGGNNGSIGMLFNIREPDGTTGGSGAKAGIFGKDYAGTWNRSSLVFCTNNETNVNDTSISDAKMVIRETGYVGINKTDPFTRLVVWGNVTTNNFDGYRYTSTGTASSTGGSDYCMYTYGNLMVYGQIRVGSDRRIKENIMDVPDNDALVLLRNIPCRYYEHIDKVNMRPGKTIGFIAQEVKSVFPIAVSLKKDTIPNVYKIIQCEWTGNVMYSQELGTVSGVKYRFYVGNSENEEKEVEIVGSSDNTFTFKQQWNEVFCYGHEVEDFHALDKQKLFALNFSATQELDRQQQADKAKISSLETKVQTLETTLASQQTLIQSLMTRLEALENP